jgi:hypothetical protein
MFPRPHRDPPWRSQHLAERAFLDRFAGGQRREGKLTVLDNSSHKRTASASKFDACKGVGIGIRFADHDICIPAFTKDVRFEHSQGREFPQSVEARELADNSSPVQPAQVVLTQR